MYSKFILIFLVAILSNYSMAKAGTSKVIRIGPCSPSIMKAESPLIFIVICNDEMQIENSEFSSFDPEHIEKIDILKDANTTKKYGSSAGVVFIHPKKKYRKFYRKKLKKKGSGT